MKTLLRMFALCGLLTSIRLLNAADDVPDWVRQAAAQTVPTYSAKVNSVVLLHEEAVTIAADGSRVMHERGVVKVLQSSGDKIEAYRVYDTKAGRVRDFQGWLIPPSGKPSVYGKNRIIDVALSTEYVYDEARAKVLDFGNQPPGSVMAWDITEEEKSLFTQDSFRFQAREPVIRSRFTLTVPANWETRGLVFNHDALEPQVSGNTSTWELRDLPWIEREEFSPSTNELAPRLVVSYFPPAGNTAGLQGLKDWSAVSSYLSTLVDPSADMNDTIRAKAAELTANANSDLDKISAIAKFVQQTHYVEISLNVLRGGGYTPHRASDSLVKNYGDCKDKATLMRSLLKAVGVESYLTTITSGERSYVRPEWASPTQFNHAIIAVRVSGEIELPTVLATEHLGRLLIFDPTSAFTPLGDLPESEQGSYALVIAGAQGALLKMPLLPPDSRRVESSISATMDPNGRLQARVERQYFGQSSVSLRAVQKMRGDEDLKKRMERTFTRRVGGTTLNTVVAEDHPEDHRVNLNVDMSAEQFGQVMQGKLLVVRPGLLSNTGEYFFATRQRSNPVRLEADLRRDVIHIKLPEGFKLDEYPRPAEVKSPYGTLTASWKVSGGEILMEQSLQVNDITVPASDFSKVRDFFDKVAGAQGAPVVLVKQ